MILQVTSQHSPGGHLAEVEHAGVGMVRGSAVNRLRPVGNMSMRLRAGAAGWAGSYVPAVRGRQAGRRARLPRCQPQRFSLALGCPSIDVEPVLHGEILEVAQPGINAAQRFVGRIGGGDARFCGETGSRGRFDDQLRQPIAATAIEAVGLRIIADQPFERLPVLVMTGGDEGRGRWPTAEMRRLAWAASPGLETMNG